MTDMIATRAADIDDVTNRAAALGGWEREHAGAVADRYLDLLERCAAAGAGLPPPDRDVDLLWHVHMLHPVSYARFCTERFGVIVDHALPDADATAPAVLLAQAGCNQKAGPTLLATAGCNGPAD